MPGIYLHIPFCKQACHYCDFHFSTTHRSMSEMVESMKQEIRIRKDYLNTRLLNSLYFGGGTPSLLSAKEIQDLIHTVKDFFDLAAGAEITLEANPDDLSPEKLRQLKEAGINRLSIGIQSFSDKDLVFMNRGHNSGQAIAALKYSREAGFENLTIDLIYGTPTLDDEQWKKNIDLAIESGVEHLSCYALTVESKTMLAKMIRDRKILPLDDEKSSRQFEILLQKTESAGFENYEISNFAKGGKYSLHNTAYWSGEKYLGIGPSAHSYDIESRQWNISNNQVYIKTIQEGKVPFEREILSRKDQFNEYVMTSLRTIWGMDIEKLKNDFQAEISADFSRQLELYIEQGQLEIRLSHVVLTRKGKLFADRIASALFL